MDCLQTSLLRDAGLRGEMAMLSAAGHQLNLNHPFAGFPPVEEVAYAPADRGGLLWENFSVDDLLDLGNGVEEQSCGYEEELLGFEDVEEEEERGRGGSPDDSNASVPSAVSFQAPPPSSDLVVPQAGDVAELEWVSRFVDDSYSEFASSSVTPPFHHHRAPAPAPPLLGAAARSETPKARFTSPGAPLKRNWGSCCFFTDSLVVPSKARSKRSRTGGRVWSRRGPPFLADSSSSAAASCSASSASSCSIASSSSSLSPMLMNDGFPGGWPATLQPQQLRMKKKRGRKPKAAAAGAAVAAHGAGAVAEQQPRRRCSHCWVDRTPQWRAGPMGPKTLCNACGVRYKSGRLLPEYRPAGSPTFLIHLHSNSHRKVLEMRRNNDLAAASSPAPAPPPPPTPAAAQLHGVV